MRVLLIVTDAPSYTVLAVLIGVALDIPQSVLGLVVLGAGNGLCHLVTYSVIARNGMPQIAVAALYGSVVRGRTL